MKPDQYSSFRRWIPTLLLAVLLSACSDSGTGPRSEMEPLVGTWRAQALELTNQANPETVVDLVEQGAVFNLSILATGGYSASLTIFGQLNVEAGTFRIDGNQFIMTPTTPPGATTQGSWRVEGGILYLDGTTEFDFNLDGTPEPADVHIEFYSTGS